VDLNSFVVKPSVLKNTA